MHVKMITLPKPLKCLVTISTDTVTDEAELLLCHMSYYNVTCMTRELSKSWKRDNKDTYKKSLNKFIVMMAFVQHCLQLLFYCLVLCCQNCNSTQQTLSQRTHNSFGNRNFGAAGLHARNSLPSYWLTIVYAKKSVTIWPSDPPYVNPLVKSILVKWDNITSQPVLLLYRDYIT